MKDIGFALAGLAATIIFSAIDAWECEITPNESNKPAGSPATAADFGDALGSEDPQAPMSPSTCRPVDAPSQA